MSSIMTRNRRAEASIKASQSKNTRGARAWVAQRTSAIKFMDYDNELGTWLRHLVPETPFRDSAVIEGDRLQPRIAFCIGLTATG